MCVKVNRKSQTIFSLVRIAEMYSIPLRNFKGILYMYKLWDKPHPH